MMANMTSIPALISHLQIANSLLCLLMAIQLLSMHSLRPLPKRLLALNCLLYAHQSLALTLVLNAQGQSDFSLFAISRPIFAMWLGPALYLYFQSVRQPSTTLGWRDALHFLFGSLILILFLCFQAFRALIDIAIISSFVTYFILIARKMRIGEQALAHLGSFANSAYRWLQSLMLMAAINIALELAVTLELAHGIQLRNSSALLIASIAFMMINTAIMLAALNRSDWLEWMYQFGEQTLHQVPTALESEIANSIFQRWEHLVNTEQLHQQEFGITLPQAAKKLHIPARQLSNAINQVYGKSFSVYLNDRRVKEAQDRLIKHPEMNIIDVMHASGFSSKSNFNKEFLRVTGMSPSGFREAHASRP